MEVYISEPHTITSNEIAVFGDITGDIHPLHRDKEWANRHGVPELPIMGAHLTAKALAEIRKRDSKDISSLEVKFSKLVYNDVPFFLEFDNEENIRARDKSFGLTVKFTKEELPPTKSIESIAGPIRAPLIINSEGVQKYNEIFNTNQNKNIDLGLVAAYMPAALVRTLVHTHGVNTRVFNRSMEVYFFNSLKQGDAEMQLWMTEERKSRFYELRGILSQAGKTCASTTIRVLAENPLNIDSLKECREIPPYVASPAH